LISKKFSFYFVFIYYQSNYYFEEHHLS